MPGRELPGREVMLQDYVEHIVNSLRDQIYTHVMVLFCIFLVKVGVVLVPSR